MQVFRSDSEGTTELSVDLAEQVGAKPTGIAAVFAWLKDFMGVLILKLSIPTRFPRAKDL